MKTILVVDDEAKIRSIYSRFLKDEGFRVIPAGSVARAYDILKHQAVDLVLLDIRMPEVDGSELYDIMQIFHRKVKVIVTSAYPLVKQQKMIMDAAGYYDKSQGIDALLVKIKKVLDEKIKEGVQCR